MEVIKTPILVTGASGFIGANVLHRLVQAGAEVHAIARAHSDLWRLRAIADRVRLHRCDLTDRENLPAVIRTIKPKTVFHLAAYGGYHYQPEPQKIFATDIFGTLNLLEACADVGFEAFINTGSSSEYGRQNVPMREDLRLAPNTPYGVAKACQTLYGQHLAREHGYPVVTLRLFTAYGPYEEPTRLVPTLIRRALARLPLQLVDPGTARDFIYVADVVEAYLRAAVAPDVAGRVINVGSGSQTPMRELVEKILALTQSPSPVAWHTYPPRSFDTDHWVCDNAQYQARLNPPPLHTLADGLRETIEWMRANPDRYHAESNPVRRV